MQKEINLDFYNKIEHIFDTGRRKGATDYIDYIRGDEITKNLMKGVDMYNRKFIIIKIGILNPNTGKLTSFQQVFFQRYTNNPDFWMSARILADNGEFMYSDGGMNEEQYKLLNDLVDGKTIMINRDHRFVLYNNHIVASMDTWENKYAKIIQKNFLMSKLNPNKKIKS